MKGYKKQHFESSSQEDFNPDERYDLAYKRVKRIKGFYVHLMVYVLVNIFLICERHYGKSSENEIFWRWETFSTVVFWGIGLLAHGISVFGKNIFFGHDWEEKKIKEFMDKEGKEKWE
jgi:hypothetical protein